jgi:DNA repair exonuclease SbcCD ATPase subunit
MTNLDKTIASLHKRIESIRQEFDGQLAELFSDLDAARAAAGELQAAGDGHDKRLRQLEERAEGQSELIETLTQEAAEARSLRSELRDRDLEIERLNSELGSKKDLVQALRHQLGDVDQLKATAKQRDKKIFEQQHELDRKQQELESAERKLETLRDELDTMSAQTAEDTAVDGAELVALKSELDARKTMIRSLREDADRASSLDAQLEVKRETIRVLEESIDQHVATIAELRRSVDAWKKKYQAAKGELCDSDQTLAEPPEFTDTEVEALRALEMAGEMAPERTVAIDMRDALKQARAQKARARTEA